MTKSVVSFTRQTSQVTPYWLLQQLAAIDAVLIFKFADQCASIKYDIPAERTPRDDYLCRIFNDASEDFRLEYLYEIWDLLGLPRNGCPVNSVSEIRIPLGPIFSEELPSGYTGEYYGFIVENLDKIPAIVEFGSPQHIQRIVLDAIRDRISRT
jgi:hypothetical protein